MMTNEARSSKPTAASAPTAASFDAYSSELQAAALNSTKLAAALPPDIGFHRSVDKDFARAIETCSERTLRLTNKLLELSSGQSSSKGKAKLQDEEDVLDSFQALVGDVLDQLFEQADTSMDEYAGRSKPPAVPVKTKHQPSATASTSRQGRLDPSITHASYLAKPQLKFNRKVDNTNDFVWAPKLKHKYNAQVPLGYALRDVPATNEEKASEGFPHPYRYEIEHISYPRRMFEHSDAIPPKSFEETPFTWVDTRRALDAMLDKLRTAQVIAVDLEHHSYRSYSGFLCLMQISTREEDFIVDTLALREELEDLNEVFTDPKIVKVFHGADSDIVWLQQDFNIYVVNLFDTYHASKLLEFPKHGLAALLEMYCDFIPDKRYQLADWRIRPLPSEMLDYARSDTHFLLFVYDNLRNALLDRSGGASTLAQDALTRSQETALRTYVCEAYDFEFGSGSLGWDTLARKWGRVLSGTQRAVFRTAHAWRDAVARGMDESTRYVLPNQYLFQLAERPPADMTALMAVFRPVPQLVRTKGAGLLVSIRAAIQESMAQTLTGSEQEANNLDQNQDLPANVPTSETVAKSAEPTQTATATSAKGSKNASVKRCDLWAASTSSNNKTISAKASAFLSCLSDVLKGKSTSTRGVSTSTSALFPISGKATNAAHAHGASRYDEVVSRIHSSLVVAPTLPKAPLQNANTDAQITPKEEGTAEEVKVESRIQTEQIEIPFVPSSERQASKMESVESDTIVVVGRAKKRKRVQSKPEHVGAIILESQGAAAADADRDIRVPGNAESAAASATETRQKRAKGTRKASGAGDSVSDALSEPKAEFDYASAPNFFDNPTHQPIRSEDPPARASKAKNAKSAKGKSADGPVFPRAPRANNELKGANKSYTFGR